MVGYYNTLPFLFGLEKENAFDVHLDIPSKCIDYFNNGDVDIALVPVGSLLNRSDYNIITDFCIGCSGEVRTVCMFFNNDIANLEKIYLDKDSRTSQKLIQILCKELWNITPEFEEVDLKNVRPEQLRKSEAILAIGDKVFQLESKFENCLDLGVEWKKLTALPFTFAVWIAKSSVDAHIIEQLNDALRIGVDNLQSVVAKHQNISSSIDLYEYFENYIDYAFDFYKKKALGLFFEFNKELQLQQNTCS